jgi:hypothetical protein
LPGYPEVKDPSGIFGLSGESSIRVYPNPVSDRLFIRTDAAAQQLTVKIYSIDGRCVYQSDFYQEDTIEIPVSDFSAQAGVYMLNVNGVVKKLVISNR